MVGKVLVFIVLSILVQQTTSVKVILFFGDSLTAGYGLSTEEAFPALVEKKINEQTKRCTVVNAGLSGETSAGGLARIDWVLRKPVDIFVLELGANDGLRGLPLDQTEKNLQGILDKVKARYPSAKVVLAGMMVPPNMGTDYSKKFLTIYPALAKKNNATLISFLLEGVAGNEKLNLPDGIHPNPEGQKIVANTVFTKLKPLL
jgi:acyl-CoA thioesterase I